MIRFVIAFVICYFMNFANAHVCNNIMSINGFYSDRLFDKAIINGSSIDYYTFKSNCNLHCIFDYLNNKNIEHNLSENNISVFDINSVATITIESANSKLVSGYLTCSSTDKRNYISIPITFDKTKVILDLQTEDNTTISRSLNFFGYKKHDYQAIKNTLQQKSTKVSHEVGFDVYAITSKKPMRIKISQISNEGGFMLIVEVGK